MVGRCAGAQGLGRPYHGGEVNTEHGSIYSRATTGRIISNSGITHEPESFVMMLKQESHHVVALKRPGRLCRRPMVHNQGCFCHPLASTFSVARPHARDAEPAPATVRDRHGRSQPAARSHVPGWRTGPRSRRRLCHSLASSQTAKNPAATNSAGVPLRCRTQSHGGVSACFQVRFS